MGLEAIKLYRQMPKSLYDEVTHICVLNACSHSGLLDEARSIFHEIPLKTEKIITTMVCLCNLFCFIESFYYDLD
jgi:pentatricopeptide repeat protein